MILLALSISGCSGGGRVEDTGTVEGTVTLNGEPLPAGAFVVREDKSNGVTMTFTVADAGKFQVTDQAKLPAGTYAVGILPPDNSAAPTEADYDKMMNQDNGAATESAEPTLEIPEEFLTPQTSGQSITVAAGAQTLEVQF